MVDKLFRMGVGLFVGIWVARYLGPEQFGVFSYAQSFVGLFAVLATLGLDGIMVRELVKDETKRDVLLGTAFLLRIVAAIFVLLLLYASTMLNSNGRDTNILIFIIASVTVFQSFNVIDFYFQSKVLSKYVAYSNFISLLISSFVKIALILNKAPLIAFAWVALFDSFVLALGFIYYYKSQKLSIFNWKYDKQVDLSLLKDSWPLILSGMVIAVYMKIDQVMIKEMLGASAVGQYAAAVKISQAWYFIPTVISSSLFPAIINAKKRDPVLYKQRLQKLYNLVVWLAILIAFPMSFIGLDLMKLLYGTAYSEAGKILMVHLWAGVFVFIGVAGSKWFICENLQLYTFYRTLTGAIINIALNLVLIRKYGAIGAAFATIISQFFATYFLNCISSKTRGQFVMQTKSFFAPFIFIFEKKRLKSALR
jgi:O-antigen/teichoic acid export membrane protein